MKKSSRKIFSFGIAVATFFATAIGVSSASANPRIINLETLGSSEGNSELSSELIASIHQAKRDESMSFLSITWGIKNTGDGGAGIIWLRDRSYSYSNPNYAGVTVTNENSGTRFHPIMDGNGECLCSGPTSSNITQQIDPGSQVAYWSLFSVPEDVETVTVEIPNFDPIEDIPIS